MQDLPTTLEELLTEVEALVAHLEGHPLPQGLSTALYGDQASEQVRELTSSEALETHPA